MSSITKVNQTPLNFSCLKAGIQFAYGRLWSFVEGCTSYACNVFTAVFIGAEQPPLQMVRRPRREFIRVEPKSEEVKNDSDDDLDIPDEPVPSSLLNIKLPRSSPIRIRAGSPKEEKLQEIEAKITQFLEKPEITQEELRQIQILISTLEHLNGRISGPSYSPRIEELSSELDNKLQNLKKNK